MHFKNKDLFPNKMNELHLFSTIINLLYYLHSLYLSSFRNIMDRKCVFLCVCCYFCCDNEVTDRRYTPRQSISWQYSPSGIQVLNTHRHTKKQHFKNMWNISIICIGESPCASHHCLHSPSIHVSPTDTSCPLCTHSGGHDPGSHALCWTSSNWQSAPVLSGTKDLKNKNIDEKFQTLWTSEAKVHLKRVRRPGPHVLLQDAQLDQLLHVHALSPAQVLLLQESVPSAQLQLLQPTWCMLPAAQLWPDASRQSHCHNWTHTPSCSNWPTHTNTHMMETVYVLNPVWSSETLVPCGHLQPDWHSELRWHWIPCWRSEQRCGHSLAHDTKFCPAGQPWSSVDV